jgi:hypothetical protein
MIIRMGTIVNFTATEYCSVKSITKPCIPNGMQGVIK